MTAELLHVCKGTIVINIGLPNSHLGCYLVRTNLFLFQSYRRCLAA